MIKVKLYGIARIKFNEKELNIEAKNIKEMLQVLATKFNVPYSYLKNFLIYVNDVNMEELKLFKTVLKDGDVVMLLSPSSGG